MFYAFTRDARLLVFHIDVENVILLLFSYRYLLEDALHRRTMITKRGELFVWCSRDWQLSHFI